MKHIVANCIFFENGKILLEKRSDNEENYAGLWSFPGGHQEIGEDIDDTLYREMREELGVSVVTHDLIGIYEDTDPTSKKPYEHYVFICTKWKGEITKSFEAHSIKWISPDEIKHLRHLTKPVSDIMEEIGDDF